MNHGALPLAPAGAAEAKRDQHYRMRIDLGAISNSLSRYGLDARARSALRAFDRYCGSEQAREARIAAMREAFPPPAKGTTAEAHGRFLVLLSEVPGRDLAGQWLDDLLRAWLTLYAAGCSPDLPSRVLRHLVAGAATLLAGERATLSRLESDILVALTNAGFFLCGVLAEAAHGYDLSRRREVELFDAETALPNARQLPQVIDECIDANPSAITGLLLGNIEVSAATLALDDDTRDRLHTASLTRIRDCLREADFVFRTGRSEFAIVLPGLRSPAQVMLAAAKVITAIERPVIVGRRPFGLTARIGGVHAPDNGFDPQGLLRCARLAMHAARAQGERCTLFDARMQADASQEIGLEQEFLVALEGDRLQLHFQPQIDTASQRCTGAEALLRWTAQDGRAVPAPRIIDMATRIGALPRLTRWIVNAACRATSELLRVDAGLQLSVNLTADDLGDPDLARVVKQSAELWRVDPAALTFELTETAMLASQEGGARVLRELHDLGASTAIDDFGTGYSSVLNLRMLPFNELKIDKSFVQQMVHSPQDREIVRSLIHLAHGLRLAVVAEGVEDTPTVDLLRDYRCERLQGYLFGKALPLSQFARWVGERQRAYSG